MASWVWWRRCRGGAGARAEGERTAGRGRSIGGRGCAIGSAESATMEPGLAGRTRSDDRDRAGTRQPLAGRGADRAPGTWPMDRRARWAWPRPRLWPCGPWPSGSSMGSRCKRPAGCSRSGQSVRQAEVNGHLAYAFSVRGTEPPEEQ